MHTPRFSARDWLKMTHTLIDGFEFVFNIKDINNVFFRDGRAHGRQQDFFQRGDKTRVQ